MGLENDTEADKLITSYPLGPIDDVAWTLDILIGLVMEEILLDFLGVLPGCLQNCKRTCKPEIGVIAGMLW